MKGSEADYVSLFELALEIENVSSIGEKLNINI